MKRDNIYRKRLDKHMDELKWLYMELYNSQDMFDGLLKGMEGFYKERAGRLRALDAAREEDPCWYRKSSMLGMMMYADHFAGSLKGVEGKLDYIAQCHVNYLHLMPLLDTPRGRSDGGYAVSDFRKVREDLGTMEDLEQLAHECHDRGISLCLDFVMNHTSEEHGWAKRARAGEKEYQDRYFFFDSWTVPSMFEETVPQVFPATAPGNFTCLPETGQYVMTTFYPYQWDLNYRNPVVFNEMMFNFLYLANRGVDVLRIDAVPYIWKELGTDCRNLPRVHTSACTFLNYLRCHDDIGWGLDYPLLERWGMRQVPHKKFLNDFFTGRIPESFSRGVLYNDDPATGDARFCGTTASMCGVEKAGFCHDRQAMEEAVRLDTMLHAFMLFQSGIPVLYSGDEVGQVNDYTYKDNPEKAPDSRYIHRGEFQWDLVERINEPETVQNRIFHNLEQLEAIRAGEPLLDAGCPFRTLETWDNSVLGMVRQDGRGKKLIGLFNFSGERRTAWVDERDGMYGDMVTGDLMEASGVSLPGYGFLWMKRQCG